MLVAPQRSIAFSQAGGAISSGPASRPHGDNLALLRFLPGRVGDDDAAGGLFLGFDTLDDHAVVERAELHAFLHLQDRIVIMPRQGGISPPGPKFSRNAKNRFQDATQKNLALPSANRYQPHKIN
jgi:hypothetical protein